MVHVRIVLHPQPLLRGKCWKCDKPTTKIIADADPNSDVYYNEYCNSCFKSELHEIETAAEYGAAYPHVVDGLIIPVTRPEMLPDTRGSQ